MRQTFQISLFSLLTLFAAGLSGADSYLPLVPNSRWVLRSPDSPKPIVLQILRADGPNALLRFDNPWLTSDLELSVSGSRYYVTTLSINGHAAPMPPETLYWDTGAGERQKWSSAIGKMEMLSRHKTVSAMGRTFHDCIQIQETNKQGNKLYWTFAPDIGFVQFGEGKDAFILESVSKDSGRVIAPPPEPPSPPSRSAGHDKIRVALAANTFANESFNPKSVEDRFQQARKAGVNLVYLSPKWNEIEPDRGKFKVDDIRYQIAEAEHANLPAILHIRIVDTNQRAVPSDLMKRAWDSDEVSKRLDGLLDKVIPMLGGRVQYFLAGNEIDGYFKQHKDEIPAYARLLRRVKDKIRSRVPDAQLSISTTFDGVDSGDNFLRPIFDQTDFFAATYYALTPDFYVKDPAGAEADLQKYLRAAGSKKIFLQEVGYPTSPVNHSSVDKQADIFVRVLDFVAANQNHFIGVNFTFMSDFSDSVVKGFSSYYKMPGADRFSSFLKTLGMFDDQGRPKKSWTAFSEKVRAVNN